MMQSVQQQNPYQEKSIVFPFMQGLPEQSFSQQLPPNMQRPMIPHLNTTGMPINPPPNMVMSPRESIQHMKPMVESIHHNIPTAESMYAQIPAELMQKQYVTLPPGQYSQLQTGQSPHQFQGHLQHQIQGQLPPHLQGQIQGQLPPGVIQSRGLAPNGYSGVQRAVSTQQQFFTPNMMPGSQPNGNFVYTRRIKDPKSNNVVA